MGLSLSPTPSAYLDALEVFEIVTSLIQSTICPGGRPAPIDISLHSFKTMSGQNENAALCTNGAGLNGSPIQPERNA